MYHELYWDVDLGDVGNYFLNRIASILPLFKILSINDIMKFCVKIAIYFGMMFVSLTANEILIDEGYIKTQYGEIYYKKLFTDKNKNDIPLLTLHGGPGLTHDSLDTLAELALEMPIIFYDQIGAGKSNTYDRNQVYWDIDFFLSDLENVIEYFKLKSIYLFGFSWGGTLALEYALKPGNRVVKLILASPFLSSEIWTKDSFALLDELGPDMKELVLNHIEEGTTATKEYQEIMNLFNQNYLYRLPEWTESMKYTVQCMNTEISEAMFGTNDFILNGNLKNYDRFKEIQTIKVPLLFMCGHYDWARPSTLEEAMKGMNNAQLIIMEKSAHMAHIEEKELYLEKIKDFLKG